jgi:hypothetical protein
MSDATILIRISFEKTVLKSRAFAVLINRKFIAETFFWVVFPRKSNACLNVKIVRMLGYN